MAGETPDTAAGQSAGDRFESLKRRALKPCDFRAGWARKYLQNSKISVTNFIDLMANVGCTVNQNDLDTDLPDDDDAHPSDLNKNLADAVLMAQVKLGFSDADCDGMLGPKTCAALIVKKEEAVRIDTADEADGFRGELGAVAGSTPVEVAEAEHGEPEQVEMAGGHVDILNPAWVVWLGTSVDVGILAGTEVRLLGGQDATSKKMWEAFQALPEDKIKGRIVVIGSTGNDTYGWDGDEKKPGTKQYLEKMVAKAKAAGAKKIVMQNRVPYGKAFTRTELVEAARIAREGIQATWGADGAVQLVDMHSKFADADGHMPAQLVGTDGWHPNAKGYKQMREYLVAETTHGAVS